MEPGLQELLIQRRRKIRLSRLYNEGKLPFRTRDAAAKCSKCGRSAKEVPMNIFDARKNIVRQEPVLELPRLLEIDDQLLCGTCFCNQYYVLADSRFSNGGSLHPAIPASQANYDGRTFSRGEW
jgi:hypothetical protein